MYLKFKQKLRNSFRIANNENPKKQILIFRQIIKQLAFIVTRKGYS
jgi:hypothetical protein